IADILPKIKREFHPDLFLWVESVGGFFPQNLQSLSIPKACYFIDTHISIDWQLVWAKNFDYVFIAQKEYIPVFKKAGIQNVYWLPLGCDPAIHGKKSSQKIYDIGFVGSILGNEHQRRRTLIEKLKTIGQFEYQRCFWEDMAELFSKSKMVFNNAIKNDLNMRLFEVMSTGTLLLTDIAKNSGQEEMFKDGEDLVIYSDDNIADKAAWYMVHESERERIAERGRMLVHNAHTYEHRLEELINVSIHSQLNTPDADEWRARSINEEIFSSAAPASKMNNSDRSFVIPVLDMSPASPFNIVKLLDDLSAIEGDVIIIFNSIEMAEELKAHPRINYYAVMNKNVGVSRAWNIGLNMSQTAVTFILNSDLHIKNDTVVKLHQALLDLDDAAIAGPQGSFFKFETLKDLQYFDKGSFNYPIAVDAVSGFLFAVKTELFNRGILKFDNQYTPCYFEEWDMGLQIKLAGLKSYIIPATEYEHEWSGSIRALRTIKYLNKEETAGEIHQRNSRLFTEKWNSFKTEYPLRRDILVSNFVEFYLGKIEKLVQFKMYDEALTQCENLLKIYPEDIKIIEKLGLLEYKRNNLNEAMEYFKKIETLDPEYKVVISDNMQ
ncbi:MAG: glycosyltransferase, partial [Syntrophothermus sp.]